MLQLSKYVIEQQSEVIAKALMDNGSMRLYEGTQPSLETRTEGRLVEAKITSAVVDNGIITISWDSATVLKNGEAGYYRLTSGNIPVMGGAIGEEMQMQDTKLLVGMILDAGELIHTVF